MRAVALVIVVFYAPWLAAAQEAPPPAGEAPPAVANTPPPVPPTRTVRVTAEGFDRDDAVRQGLRKALEQGAGAQLAAYSQVENFALARDTIYSRAAGIVTDYRVLDGPKEVAGLWEVTLEATVRPDAVAQAWGEVQNVLDQIGRPKIMVWIDETIDDRPQPDSVVAAGIEEMFVKAGFDVVARQAIDDIRKREAAAAKDEKNAEKLARLAKDAGAHLLIRGSANANSAGRTDPYGVPAAFYNCDVQARVYYTDTGKLLTAESIPVTRRGARSHKEYSPQAARAALLAATFPRNDVRREPALALKLYESVMEQWSTAISAGGDIELEVESLDFKQYVALKKALAEIPRVRSVDGDFTKSTGVFRIKALMQAQTLAERLTEPPFADWLEVVDLKPNRVQCKGVAKR